MESNAPIGLWPELDFVGEEIETISGKLLFIYSDGLNEAENVTQQQYGDERLLSELNRLRAAPAKQVVSSFARSVEQHRAGAAPNDDLTMLAIRCLG